MTFLFSSRLAASHFLISCAHLQDGWASLHYAACNGHLAVIGALIDHGADINVTEKVLCAKSDFWTLLCHLLCMCLHSNFEHVVLFARLGALHYIWQHATVTQRRWQIC